MTVEDAFDSDVEHSAFARTASWQAGQFERVEGIREQIARLEAEEARVLAGLLVEAEGEAAEDAIDADDPAQVTRRHDLAVRSIATELAATTRTSLRAAQARLGEAWTLATQLPDTLAALEAGQISRAHAHELIAETDHLSARRGEAEEALLPLAKRLPAAQFRRRAKRVLETLEKDSLHARHARAFARRRVDVTAGRDGMAHLEAYLDAVDAAVITAGLTNAANEARTAGDSRTATQLQADLFVELLADGTVTICTPAPTPGGQPGTPGSEEPGSGEPGSCKPRSGEPGVVLASTGTVAGRAPVSVEVLIPAAILAGHDSDDAAGAEADWSRAPAGGSGGSDPGNDDGRSSVLASAAPAPGRSTGAAAEITGLGAIDPARARLLVAKAPSLRRILTDPITSAILDFDRTTYRVPAELKRVIARRDGRCRAPGCSTPIANCEIDHTQPAAQGGPTALWNLAHLCANHHHLKHEAGWGLKQYLGGYLHWTAPSGRSYLTHPETDVSGPAHQPADPWAPPNDRQPAPFDVPDGDHDSGDGNEDSSNNNNAHATD